MSRNHVETVVIGGSQAGLAVGYYLQRHGLRFVIVDENDRVGDAWRNRWDTLRLFTPARHDGLPGIVESVPGLYFMGLLFLYSLSSALLGGVGRDAEHIVDHIASNRPPRKEVRTATGNGVGAPVDDDACGSQVDEHAHPAGISAAASRER